MSLLAGTMVSGWLLLVGILPSPPPFSPTLLTTLDTAAVKPQERTY